MNTAELHNDLSERERIVLRTIIHLYILKAAPIGSRFLSKYLEGIGRLSPATIRNVMADLEEMNYISHPHTSAGRIPTDKGYRFFVDTLSELIELTEPELKTVDANLNQANPELVLRDASKVLSMLSRFLGIVEIPHLIDLIIEKIEIVPISSNRLLVIVVLDNNIVKTVNLEDDCEIDYRYINDITGFVNEKVSGRKLRYLRENFNELIDGFPHANQPLVKLIVSSVDKIFEYQGFEDRLLIAGTKHLLMNPEFEDLQRVRSVIEILENEDILMQLLNKLDDKTDKIQILIGKEMDLELLEEYSLIISSY
ncbi:MAG: Heat-inducible transcription repressor HrcA, partial [Bacteroidota bacterium]|nr:Heat-inducible transcription repressor HrcA [Bacteroidota bacterium]